MIIALIGPDGCGKSTIADKVVMRINQKEPGMGVSVHFRPMLLPNINELLTGRKFEIPEDGIILPHTHPPSGLLVSAARFLYYFFDYTVGHAVKIRPLLKQGKTVIYDRHFYDFITDPARARIRLPKWFLNFSMRFVPKPDFTFLLFTSPEIMRQRKPELTIEELKQQLRDYRDLLPRLKNAHEISNEGPVELTVENILKMLTRKD